MVRGREASGYSASMDASTEPLWLPVKAYVAEQMPLASCKSNCGNVVKRKKKTRTSREEMCGSVQSMEECGKNENQKPAFSA